MNMVAKSKASLSEEEEEEESSEKKSLFLQPISVCSMASNSEFLSLEVSLSVEVCEAKRSEYINGAHRKRITFFIQFMRYLCLFFEPKITRICHLRCPRWPLCFRIFNIFFFFILIDFNFFLFCFYFFFLRNYILLWYQSIIIKLIYKF